MPEYPTNTREQYRFSHMPAAVMALVDEENDEFHAKQLHIDYSPKVGYMVLDDGLVFCQNGKILTTQSADRLMFITDAHVPHTHGGTLGAFRAIMTKFAAGTVVDGGDAADFESVNRHAKGKPGETENLRLINDINNLAMYLTSISNFPSVKQRVLIDSNHHDWLTEFVKENPCLKGLLDWPTIAKQWLDGWEVFLRRAGENVIFRFGDLIIRHGDQESLKKGEALNQSGKYLCGHHHWFMAYRRAIQQGCAAKLGPGYTKNEINKWQSQISTATKFDEVAAVNPKIVLHDEKNKKSRVAYQDSIFEVDYHELKFDR
jgi:hypothetical protein